MSEEDFGFRHSPKELKEMILNSIDKAKDNMIADDFRMCKVNLDYAIAYLNAMYEQTMKKL